MTNNEPNVPEVNFSERECIVLREYIERLERHVTLAAVFVPDHKDALRLSDEEKDVLENLRHA